MLSLVEGTTVGSRLPWPRWPHSDTALDDVGAWLRDCHRALADYVPPAAARWREGRPWAAGMIVGHGDPGPYNAVWGEHGLVALIDWDNAGPAWPEDDLAWTAFAWTPLHARRVVTAEGFTDFGRRRDRLARLLAAYGWAGSVDELLARVAVRVRDQVAVLRRLATSGDPAYRAMLSRGQDLQLEDAVRELDAL